MQTMYVWFKMSMQHNFPVPPFVYISHDTCTVCYSPCWPHFLSPPFLSQQLAARRHSFTKGFQIPRCFWRYPPTYHLDFGVYRENLRGSFQEKLRVVLFFFWIPLGKFCQLVLTCCSFQGTPNTGRKSTPQNLKATWILSGTSGWCSIL